jgi:hypothetical protein
MTVQYKPKVPMAVAAALYRLREQNQVMQLKMAN